MIASLVKGVFARLFVLQTGLATSILALLGVYLLGKYKDWHVIGWYYHYVPVGAIGVGFVAAVGYTAAAWFKGMRINKPLLVVILLLQILAYFGAEYIQYWRMQPRYWGTGRLVPFFTYFHFMTRSFAWDGGHGEALGDLGYLLRLAEIGGFALGSLVMPSALIHCDYCADCQRFRKSRELGCVAVDVSELVPVHADAGDEPDDGTQEPAVRAARSQFDRLIELARLTDIEGFRAVLRECAADPKDRENLTCYFRLAMSWCPCCKNGSLHATIVYRDEYGSHMDIVPSTLVPPAFVAGYT